MFKLNKLAFSLIVVMLLSLVTPFASLVSKANPITTDVTIHKITGVEELEGSWEALTGSKPEGHQDGTPISNISFTYFKVSKDQYDQLISDMINYDNAENVQELVGFEGVKTGLTDKEGQVTVIGLEEGYYYFVENGSSAVRTANAVPFGLELPFTNQDGNGYIENLHVWPKNTLEDFPVINKTVEDLESKSNSYDIGESFVWNIQTTVPKGIEEYTLYRITDELDDALDFDGESVRIYYGPTVLSPTVDYNLTYVNHTITASLTEDGLAKLGEIRDGETKLVMEITTRINEKAIMGLPIVNDARLDFDNNHGNSTTPGDDGTPPSETPPTVETPPVVYTGGKTFVKVDSNGGTLQNAEFVIKNDKNLFLSQSGSSISWVESQSNATVFTSDAEGRFEIQGLKYGELGDNNQGSTSYTLVETKAPEGYALPTNPETTFVVNASSYYSNPAELTLADPMGIVNRKVTIPNTGGMGTILFTVIGLLLMVFAFAFLRRKESHSN